MEARVALIYAIGAVDPWTRDKTYKAMSPAEQLEVFDAAVSTWQATITDRTGAHEHLLDSLSKIRAAAVAAASAQAVRQIEP